MVVDFDFSQVGDFFNRITIGERGYAYVADRNGEILFHPKQGQFTEKDQANVQSVLFRGDGTYVTENEEYSIGYRTISHTGWMVVGVSYLYDIFMPALSRMSMADNFYQSCGSLYHSLRKNLPPFAVFFTSL